MFRKLMALAMINTLAISQIRPVHPDEPEDPDVPQEIIESPVNPPTKPPKWDDDFTKDHDNEIVHWDDEYAECPSDDELCESEEEWEEEEVKWQQELSDEKLDPEDREGKCYGIALADATDFGPYQAGAIIGLLKHQESVGQKYSVITGIALGAINAYIMSLCESTEIRLA